MDDVENLLWPLTRQRQRLIELHRSALTTVVPTGRLAFGCIAAPSYVLAEVAWDIPNYLSPRAVRGTDAADLLLCRWANEALDRYLPEELVILSGDHAFVGLARRARAMGIPVTVVARRRSLHWELYRTATATEILDVPPWEPTDG